MIGHRALMLSVLMPAPLVAQTQFAELGKMHLPRDRSDSYAMVAGDVDGDGDPDLVVGNTDNGHGDQNRLYLNDGAGRFVDNTAAAMPIDDDETWALALGDVDADGDLDLVCGNRGQSRLYLNVAGAFTDVTLSRLPPGLLATVSVVLGDVDQDGDLDLICGTKGCIGGGCVVPDRLYLNDGTGTFTAAPPGRLPSTPTATYEVAFADVDGDGDLDLVLAVEGGGTFLYDNVGAGTFVDVSGTRLPQRSLWAAAVALADLDADGDVDIVAGNIRGSSSELYLNDGTGVFRNATTRMPPGADFVSSITASDLDLDGDLDLILTGGNTTPRVYLNDGSARFTDMSTTSLPPREGYDSCSAAVAIDLDGDLDADLVFANGRSTAENRIYLNDGRAHFADGSRLPFFNELAGVRTAVIAIDIEGDGDLDFVAFGNPNRLYRNDGDGDFGDVSSTHLPSSQSASDVAAGDVDGDGDVDLLLAVLGQHNRLYLNDGTGRFTDATTSALPPDSDWTSAIALADVDRDGDLDVFFGNWDVPRQTRLYLNDGTGHFRDVTASHLNRDSDATSDLAVGDMDGDGDVDLLCANYNATVPNRLYLNDGTGRFVDATESRLPPGSSTTRAVAVGDVDGDGDLDVFWGNDDFRQDELYINDGRGTFANATAIRLPGIDTWTENAVFGDVDEDGDLDVITGPVTTFYLNDGTGRFTDATTARLPEWNRTCPPILADLDGDGDLDLFAGSQPNRLYHNLHRQAHTPFLAELGKSFVFTFYAKPGYAQGAQFVLPLFATARARIPLSPFGVLGLDPTQMIGLPIQQIPFPRGSVSVTCQIPRQTSLVGKSIHAQALMADGTTVRFTNVTSDVIR